MFKKHLSASSKRPENKEDKKETERESQYSPSKDSLLSFLISSHSSERDPHSEVIVTEILEDLKEGKFSQKPVPSNGSDAPETKSKSNNEVKTGLLLETLPINASPETIWRPWLDLSPSDVINSLDLEDPILSPCLQPFKVSIGSCKEERVISNADEKTESIENEEEKQEANIKSTTDAANNLTDITPEKSPGLEEDEAKVDSDDSAIDASHTSRSLSSLQSRSAIPSPPTNETLLITPSSNAESPRNPSCGSSSNPPSRPKG